MKEDSVALLEFENNPNIGLFMFVNDSIALLGENVSDEKKEQIESVLKVPVYFVSVLGTSLPGVFVAGNEKVLIVPEMYDYEMDKFKRICEENSLELLVLSDKLNTFGNNLCVTNEFILSNPHYPESFLKEIENKTDLSVYKVPSKEIPSVGGVCCRVCDRLYVSQELNEKMLEPVLDNIGGVGTVNSGGIFVSSGIVGNKNGVLLGSQSSTVEIQNIVEGLGFLDK